MTSGKDMWRHAAMRAAVSFMSAVDSSVSTSSLSAGIDAAASVLKWLPSERRMPLDYVEGLDHMQYQWFAQRFRQGDVAAENVGLRVDAGSAQTVYARLAYGCDRRMCCGALKQFEIRCRAGLPRMYAHGIMLAFFWTEEGRTHADDCVGACGVVCVAVDEHRRYGTGS